VTDSSEQENESSGSIKVGKFLDQLHEVSYFVSKIETNDKATMMNRDFEPKR
jgi:hypothetical protein